MCVIRPGEGAQFVAGLPIRRFHGVGPKAEAKMQALGILTGADLAAKDFAFLRQHFGSMADYLFRAARGIDLRPVAAHRIRKSVGGERTFSEDIGSGAALRETLANIVDIVWDRIEAAGARGRTVTLKLKFTDFQIMTRATSLPGFVSGKPEFARLARALLEAELPLRSPIRLMGLTLSALEGAEDDKPARDEAQLRLL
jgi:DNA polymerase-4